MKFRFTTSIAGPGYHFTAGVEIEPTAMDPHLKQWLEAGILEPVKTEREIAVLGAPERAVSLRRRGRRVRQRSAPVA
jgi:hypothetical protein